MSHPAKAVICAVAFILLAFLAALAFGGETVTYKPVTYSLLGPTGTPISKGYATLETCVAAAPVPAVDYRCTITNVFSKLGTCDDVPMPVMPTTVNANGFMVQPGIVIEAKPDGSWGPTMEEGFVKGAYPNCWVKGLVPYDGKFRAPELPPTAETSPWIEGVDEGYPLGGECPEAAHGNCYASPNTPRAPPAGCTNEFCVTG